MFEVFRRTRGYTPELWAATEGPDILALFLPVRVTLFNGALRQFTTRSVAFGGILCSDGDRASDALATLLHTYSHAVGRSSLFTELRNISSVHMLQHILQNSGFAYEDHLNFLIDLNRPCDALFHSIGGRTRKNIRRILRSGTVVIEDIRDRTHLSRCYGLLRQTYNARRIPLPDSSLFEAAFDMLLPKEMIRFTLASVQGIPVGTSVDLLYKNRVYGWYGAVDRSYSPYIPSELLTWDGMQWGASRGYSIYDFGGAGKPNEKYGVRDFKAKFGGVQVNYGRSFLIHQPSRLKMCRLAYAILRRFLF